MQTLSTVQEPNAAQRTLFERAKRTPQKIGKFLKNRWFEVATPLIPAATLYSDQSTVAGAFIILAAECVAGSIGAFMNAYITLESLPYANREFEDRADRSIKNGKWRLAGALMFGAAATGTIVYDNHNISTSKAVESMYASGDRGPRTFREDYNISKDTYVFTMIGKKYRWDSTNLADRQFIEITSQEKTSALKGMGNVECIMYWGAYTDTKRKFAERMNPQPDISKRPDYTFGRCDQLVNLMYPTTR